MILVGAVWGDDCIKCAIVCGLKFSLLAQYTYHGRRSLRALLVRLTIWWWDKSSASTRTCHQRFSSTSMRILNLLFLSHFATDYIVGIPCVENLRILFIYKMHCAKSNKRSEFGSLESLMENLQCRTVNMFVCFRDVWWQRWVLQSHRSALRGLELLHNYWFVFVLSLVCRIRVSCYTRLPYSRIVQYARLAQKLRTQNKLSLRTQLQIQKWKINAIKMLKPFFD